MYFLFHNLNLSFCKLIIIFWTTLKNLLSLSGDFHIALFWTFSFNGKMGSNYKICRFWCHLGQTFLPWDSSLMFVCFVFFVWGFLAHWGFFSVLWRRHYHGWKAENVDLCSAPVAIEQWGFLSTPETGASVYNGQREPVTLAPVAERLAVELSLPVLRHRSVAD